MRDIIDYFYHGKNHDGDVVSPAEAKESVRLAAVLARELTEELNEIQAENDPLRALVTRVRRNTRKE